MSVCSVPSPLCMAASSMARLLLSDGPLQTVGACISVHSVCIACMPVVHCSFGEQTKWVAALRRQRTGRVCTHTSEPRSCNRMLSRVCGSVLCAPYSVEFARVLCTYTIANLGQVLLGPFSIAASEGGPAVLAFSIVPILAVSTPRPCSQSTKFYGVMR